MRARAYKAISSASILAAALVEANHSFVQRAAWAGFEPRYNNISYFLVPLWIAAIAGIWNERAIAKPAAIIGIFLLASHGVVLCFTGNQASYGIPYLLLAAAAAVCALLGHSPYYSGAQLGAREEREEKRAA
jgi:hypothetical protein